jgi:OOP family OmpA-OmpF porin
MKIKNLVLTAVASVVLLGSTANAQDEANVQDEPDTSGSLMDKLPAWMDQVYIGAGMGSALSYTDIKQYPFGTPALQYRTELGYGFNAYTGYKLNPYFSFTGSLSWVRLNGTKRSMPRWFTSSVFQWDASAKFNVANFLSKKTIESRKFDINFIAGLGISAFRTHAHSLVNGYSSDPVIAVVGYNTFDLENSKRRRTLEGSVHGGTSVSYRLNSQFDINLDMRLYYLNSDYLDAFVSRNASNDMYVYNSIGAIYHFGGRAAVKNDAAPAVDTRIDEMMEKFKDTDGDGVADYLDKDNNTPAGVKVYADGTAVDTDGDGVADYLDQERVSPCKEVDANGVSKDGDTDGVADCNDIEPNTKAGAQVDSKGKAIASGPIGISPVVTNTDGGETVTSGVISGLPSVFFPSNSSSVSYKNYNSLTQVAQFMKANPGAKLIVVGNSDKSGSASYNKVLGERRAKSVVDYFVTRNGIDASRFTVQSKGSEDPISTRRNSGQDRRVDFLLGQ